MRKFAIGRIKGSDSFVIQTFAKKADAIAFGERHYADLPKDQGLMCCYAADFDDNDQRTSNVCWIYEVWC